MSCNFKQTLANSTILCNLQSLLQIASMLGHELLIQTRELLYGFNSDGAVACIKVQAAAIRQVHVDDVCGDCVKSIHLIWWML